MESTIDIKPLLKEVYAAKMRMKKEGKKPKCAMGKYFPQLKKQMRKREGDK